MTFFKSTIILLLVAAQPFCLTGCISFYTYRPVTVSVRDAETNAPIPDARITLIYRNYLVLNRPHGATVRTDPQGLARFRVATVDLVQWNAEIENYLYDNQYPAGATPRNVEFKLYRAPNPEVTVIVPNAYRGPLKIEKRAVNSPIQVQAGKRYFTYTASPTGFVLIDATPLLLRTSSIDKAKYADGRRITDSGYANKPDEVALRFVTSNAHDGGFRALYVIGTQQDEQAIHPLIYDHPAGDPSTVSLNLDKFNALFKP